MSIQTADAARKSIQSVLGVQVDGIIGPKTRAAFERLISLPGDAEWPSRASSSQEVPSSEADGRSERNIETLHPKVRPAARALIKSAAASGIAIKIISGTRTYAEQDALYAQGGVTKAKGGYSNHNFGLAFDIGIFSDGKYLSESPRYTTVGHLGKQLGLSWGGDWQSFQDEPHFELRPEWAKDMSESDMVSELRHRHALGMDAFA